MDKFRIDSHKMIFHPERLSAWLNGKETYPIYLEISPSGGCNHRCIYCALDFMEYRPIFLDSAMLKKRVREMALLGVKSIMYAGEGEPLLHKDITSIVNSTKKAGIDVAITTNGVFLNKDFVKTCLKNISWIKISINAANPKTYSKIHRAKSGDFEKVINNLKFANSLRKSKGYKCTLGMQLLLLPENKNQVVALAKIAKGIGMDYLVIKPYSQHPFSKTRRYKDIRYTKFEYLSRRLEELNSDKFNVIFRLNTMRKWDRRLRTYKHCLALPFWSYIDSSGNVWGCSAYLSDKRFLYGNIYKNTFMEIWMSQKRKRIVKIASEKLDTGKCRVNCRMDEINRYLWELKHPPEHMNFI